MTPRNIFNLFLISLNILFAGLSLALLVPFYPGEALSKGVSITESGLVLGSVFITTVVGTYIYIAVYSTWYFILK